jgi:hypothetical protein
MYTVRIYAKESAVGDPYRSPGDLVVYSIDTSNTIGDLSSCLDAK